MSGTGPATGRGAGQVTGAGRPSTRSQQRGRDSGRRPVETRHAAATDGRIGNSGGTDGRSAVGGMWGTSVTRNAAVDSEMRNFDENTRDMLST